MSDKEAIRRKLENFDYVRFSMCDINGMYRGQTVAARHAYDLLEEGVNMFEGILVAGPRTEMVLVDHEKMFSFGNCSSVPDPETLRPIPWAEGGVKVAEMLCETRWMVDNSPQLACPRYVARQQLKRLSEQGLELLSGFEVEFKLYGSDGVTPVFKGSDVFSQRIYNKHSKILFEFDQNFQKSQIDVESLHVEFGDGMFEAVTKPKKGIESIDMVMNLKQALMEISDLKEMIVSFMSRENPSVPYSGIALHFNFSLLDKSGKNVFYDESSPDKLSPIAKHWIAGIVKHSRALCAFTSPTVNCYRRLHQEFFPSKIFWGIENRESVLRLKNHGPKSTYMESRAPSGKSNPYLVAAATIAAGLDGVEKKMECPPQGDAEDTPSLPKSLSEALEELEADSDLVDSLGKEFVSWFVKCKQDGEVALYKDIENDEEKLALEREKYFL